MKMKKFEASIYYRDDEEFQDALERLSREVGDVQVRVIDECPMHSGGWPIVEIVMPEELIAKFAAWQTDEPDDAEMLASEWLAEAEDWPA